MNHYRFSQHLLASFTLLFALTGASLRSEPAANPSSTVKLPSTFYRWEDMEVKATPVGQFRQVIDSVPTATFEKLEFHITTLQPGLASHPPHHHPQEEIILVKEGTVEAHINGKPLRGGPGSLFFYAAHDLHNLSNVGASPATYFVINVYSAITLNTPDKPAADYAPDKLHSGVFDWEKIASKPNKTGSRKDYTDSPTVTFTRLEAHATTLNAGVSLPPHPDADEELIIIKEGSLEATIHGVKQRGGPGSIFFFSSNYIR